MDALIETAEGVGHVKDALAREKVFLTQQAAEPGIKILPGTAWALHYPHGVQKRMNVISGLLTGDLEPHQAAAQLKPDALLFPAPELMQTGLAAVAAKIRDYSSTAMHTDYERFARFLHELQGLETTPKEAEAIYTGITQSRVRKQMHDVYGFTGRQQLEAAWRLDVETTVQQAARQSATEKVFSALKLDWLATQEQLIGYGERDLMIADFSPQERDLFDRLRDPYHAYVRSGGEESYSQVVDTFKAHLRERMRGETAQAAAQQELEKDLEPFMDQAEPPGMRGDPGIPPEDEDEYHTPPVPQTESHESIQPVPFFEITPSGVSSAPLVGYFAEGRKSYYDPHTKTWSKKKQLTKYDGVLRGEERQTISAVTTQGLKAIPIPNGYGLDMSSLHFTGARPEILRDQNGCFYIRTSGMTQFTVDFLQEHPPFIGPPIAEDSFPIHQGTLSDASEKILQSVHGTDIEKAEQILRYLLASHVYPGDGDLRQAQALQLKLRTQSTGENYIQNLDSSGYLECYSANTLFVAMLRKIGVSARLVIGHKVESAKDGKAVIDAGTGHAWAEVWDGSRWRRFDATPKAKQPPQNTQQDEHQASPSQRADDGGIERPPDEPSQESPTSGSGQTLGDASDQDVAQGEANISKAQQDVERAEAQRKQLSQQIEDAESFTELEAAQKAMEGTDLFDDQKQELQQKIDAQETQMKEKIKQSLEEMAHDGFLDSDHQRTLEEQIESTELEQLDRLQREIEHENTLYTEYQQIKEEIMPLVEKWYEYFVERLPRETAVEVDEDSLTRQGTFNRHSVMRTRNLLFGTVKNPRVLKSNTQPKFLASIMVDVSGSMKGEKLTMARKLLVFYNELFSRISEEFGYIRYANNIFSDTLIPIKTFDQEYTSATRYEWNTDTPATIKAHLMESIRAQGGTDMLPAIRQAASDLNREVFDHPDYASAFYFIGDGEDTQGNAKTIRKFLRMQEEGGFGTHMLSAIMLGNASQRRELAKIFGDEQTTVAPDFETLIEQSMYKFDQDIETYLEDKVV